MLLWPISFYFLVMDYRARRGSRVCLQRILGRQIGLRDIFRHIHRFAEVTLDRVYFLLGGVDEPKLHVSGRDVLLDALGRGKGCLLLGAHIGSFDAMRALGAERNIRMRMLMYRRNLGGATAALEALAPDYEAGIIAIGQPDTMLKVAESLARGEVVGILADRAAIAGRSVGVHLFGREIRLPEGPFRLALLTGAPIVMASALRRNDGSYDVKFEAMPSLLATQGRGRRALVQAAAERYAAWMENLCRAHPFAWFNFYDYWNETT